MRQQKIMPPPFGPPIPTFCPPGCGQPDNPWDFPPFWATIGKIRYVLPVISGLPLQDQEKFVEAIFEGLEVDGLLTADEVQYLRGVRSGKSLELPLFNPDGSPSLCGVLAQHKVAYERGVGGAIIGAALGAGVGSSHGSTGAVVGALIGGVAGSYLPI